LQVEIEDRYFEDLKQQLLLPDPTDFLVFHNLNPHSRPYVVSGVVACQSPICAQKRVGSTGAKGKAGQRERKQC
jgi:hypothetical protein